MHCISLSPFFPGTQTACLVPPPATGNQCGWHFTLNISKHEYAKSQRIKVKRTSDEFWVVRAGVPGSQCWVKVWLTSLKFESLLFCLGQCILKSIYIKPASCWGWGGAGGGRLVCVPCELPPSVHGALWDETAQSNHLTHLLLVGKAGELSCLLPFTWWWFLSPLPPPLFLMIWVLVFFFFFFLLVQPVTCPQLPFILCRACRAFVQSQNRTSGVLWRSRTTSVLLFMKLSVNGCSNFRWKLKRVPFALWQGRGIVTTCRPPQFCYRATLPWRCLFWGICD